LNKQTLERPRTRQRDQVRENIYGHRMSPYGWKGKNGEDFIIGQPPLVETSMKDYDGHK
jgi:hypothetical protein